MIVLNDHADGTFVDIVETATGRSLRLVPHSFTRAVWGKNSDVVYAEAEDSQVYRLSLDGAAAPRIDKVALTGAAAVPADEAPRVLAYPSPAASFLVVQTSRPHQRLYRCALNPDSGGGTVHTRCTVLVEDGRGVLHWLLTAQGRVAARIRLSSAGQREFQIVSDAGEWTSLFHYRPYYTVWKPVGSVQPDGTIWALSNRGRERVALVRLDLATGQEEVFFEHDRYDLTHALVHFDADGTGTPLLVACDPDYQTVVHFHDGLKAAYEALYEKIGKPTRIDAASVDRRAKFAVVMAANPRIHRRWYLLDLENHTSRELSASRLAPHPPSPSRPVTFRARDGLQLYAYLTLPSEAGAAPPFPMILMLHGGPWDRYYWPDQALVQFLAGKGYSVLRLNYRGSSGYNRSYLAAGNEALFRSMQHDVLDAAEWAAANGYAKRDRTALFGGSFGGFLTLVMLAHHPDRFSAGVAVNAITDAVDFWSSEWLRPFNRVLWREFLGADVLPRVALAQLAPVNNLDRITAPVQLIVGSRDERIPPAHSHELFYLLKESGKTVQLVEFESASHSIWSRSRGSHIVASLAAFLDEHLGGKR